MTALPLFPTTLVGSYPQPDWLIDRAKLAGRFPPRVRARELWRPGPEYLARGAGRRDAARDPRPGGRRASTSSPTARSAGRATPTTSRPRSTASTSTTPARRWTAAATRTRCRGSSARSAGPARSSAGTSSSCGRNTDRTVKVTVPGPFTMSQQAQDDYYGDPRSVALAYAEACNEEVRDLFAAGADIVQLDEPYMQARPEPAREYGLEALNRALDGVAGTTAVHICFGYAAIIHERPSGYSFLPELADCPCDQVSIETAQSDLDPSVLKHLPDKTIILGVLDLSEHDGRDRPRSSPSGSAAALAVRRRRARWCSRRTAA